MPEDIKPPKTIEEVGIHLVYMAVAQNATNASLRELKQTLKDMQQTQVPQVDFDEHVIWGKAVILDHDTRITKLERASELENSSTMHKVLKVLDAKIVSLIVLIMFGTFLYGTYIMVKYNYYKSLPPIEASK